MTLRNHTIKSISIGNEVDVRTAKRWLEKANKEQPELGEMRGNTRYFSDYEKSFIESFGSGRSVAAKTINPTPYTPVEFVEEVSQNETDISQSNFVETAIVPQTFNMANLRGGLAATPTIDPNTVAQALTVMDQVIHAMDSDIQQQQAQLQQTQELARQLKDKAAQVQQNQIIYQLRSEVNQLIQNQSNSEAQSMLGKFQSMSGGGS